MNMVRGEGIDNAGQRCPRSLQSKVDEVRVFRGEIIDKVGQQSPRTETNSRIPEVGVGSNSINFTQSVTQTLASLGRDGYFNPREGLAVISAYTDTWKETMTVKFNDQEERLLGLENQVSSFKNTVERYEDSVMGFCNEVTNLNEMIDHHERTVPSWRREIETSLGKVNSVLSKVEDRMEEFMIWISHIKETN